MSVIRAFIAIDLAAETRKKIDKITAELRQRISANAVRWVPAENIHLTLKFLGDVSLNNLTLLTNALKAEATQHARHQFSAGGLGVFPRPSNPRVIWVGIEAPETLLALQRGVEAQMSRLGYERDQRPFTAHLTLGRVARNATPRDARQISETLASYPVGSLGTTEVAAVNLYRSDLQPSGAVYTRLFSAPLAPGG